ncbi:MAG: acyltransferase [Flavobacteriaceae bacterium]
MKNIINILLLFSPSFIHIRIRRLMGQKIGSGVKLKLGTLIITNVLEIGDNSKLGPFTFIKSNELRIGESTIIKPFAIIKTFKVDIFNYVHIAPLCVINSEFTENSRIEIGDHSRIFPFCWLDTGEGIKIGKQVGVGGHTLMFTHGVWSNFVEGGPVDSGPIEIKDNVWLPWRVFILPNVTIGKNTIVGANSLINKDVKDNMLVAGSPAKDIKKLKFDNSQRSERLNTILRKYSDYINFKLKIQSQYKKNKLLFKSNKIVIDDFDNLCNGDLLIILDKNYDNIKHFKKKKISVIDYKAMTFYLNGNKNIKILQFNNFLRRFGVRLNVK